MKEILWIAIVAFGMEAVSQGLPGEMYYSADGKILYSGGQETTGLYQKDIIREVHLDFSQANYWTQLATNYESETEIPATMTLDGVVYDSIGVRFRGNTSYFTIGNSQKKSFAVSSDFIHPDQKFMGYKNLKFNNAHQDPTMMREVLYCQMAARHIPIAKANFIHLFLNNQDWGIYPNIQSVDKTFLEGYFLSNDGAMFRATTGETGMGGGGGPGWGDGTAGLNYLGTDTTTYQEYYALKSSDVESPWQKLIDACQILDTATNSNRVEVSTKIDIDKALWFLAVENIFTDDDSYTMKGKMDYIVYYEPETYRTTPLEYDGNSSFETNFATSASWGPFKNVTNVNYPLLNKLLNIPEWRQRYLAHYRTILNETFTVEKAHALIDTFDARIKVLVNSDTKKLYPFSQYTSGVPGLKTFVTNRRNYLLNNAEVAQTAPTIASAPFYNSVLEEYKNPGANENAIIQATVTSSNGINGVNLYYATGLVGNFTVTPMYDDGAHEDGANGDGIFGAQIPGYAAQTFVRYYVEAIADNAAFSASYLPSGAEHDIFVYTVAESFASNGVVINEILASNDVGQTDEAGEHEDWIELYNTNDFEVDLSGFYLSDNNAVPDKWQIPAGTVLPAESYLIIWADEDKDDGPYHASFKLSAGGESLLFSDGGLNVLDQIEFGAQTIDMGYARIPNGTGNFVIQQTTYNANNEDATGTSETVTSLAFMIYPNPFTDQLWIRSEQMDTPLEYSLTDQTGRVVKTGKLPDHHAMIPVNDLSPGMYFVRLGNTKSIVVKAIKL